MVDLRAPQTVERLAEQQRACETNGANGTPTLLVNGLRLAGAHAFEVFAQLLDEELAAPN